MERFEGSDKFPIGSSMPVFSLRSTDESTINNAYFEGARASLVVFSCNHCPYVKGSEDMLIAIVRRFESEGLRTVAINSNDASRYPEDDFNHMVQKAEKKRLPYPYLFDESQQVAKLFDAACTPECFLFDSTLKLVYHGAIGDNPEDPSARRNDYLTPAIEQTIAGRYPQPSFKRPMGCSIKWKL